MSYIDVSLYVAEIATVLTNTLLHDATSTLQYGTGILLRGAYIDIVLCNITL